MQEQERGNEPRMQLLSNSQLDKASKKIRRYGRGELSAEEAQPAFDVVRRYRAAFSEPLEQVLGDVLTFLAELEVFGRVSHSVARQT